MQIGVSDASGTTASIVVVSSAPIVLAVGNSDADDYAGEGAQNAAGEREKQRARSAQFSAPLLHRPYRHASDVNHRAHISHANLQRKHTTRPHQLLREKALCAAGTTTGTIGDYIIVPPDSSEVYGIASTQSGIAGVNNDAHTAHESCSDGSAQVREQTDSPVSQLPL